MERLWSVAADQVEGRPALTYENLTSEVYIRWNQHVLPEAFKVRR